MAIGSLTACGVDSDHSLAGGTIRWYRNRIIFVSGTSSGAEHDGSVRYILCFWQNVLMSFLARPDPCMGRILLEVAILLPAFGLELLPKFVAVLTPATAPSDLHMRWSLFQPTCMSSIHDQISQDRLSASQMIDV